MTPLPILVRFAVLLVATLVVAGFVLEENGPLSAFQRRPLAGNCPAPRPHVRVGQRRDE
jgi:hypothetical protein